MQFPERYRRWQSHDLAQHVEYSSFQEIVITDGQAIEMPVPGVMAICSAQKAQP
jgi:hypothetical protein